MIYVVRHGQTDLNKQGRLQGRQGLPLNDAGMKQAEWLREHLSRVTFDYVFSSLQDRAIQTAEIITGQKAVTDSRLDVFDLGEADLLLKEEVKLAGVMPDPRFYQGVEELNHFVNRVFGFMKELELQPDTKEANILISGHRCTTGCMGAYFMGIPEDGNLLQYSSGNGDYKTYTFKSGV